MINRSTDPDAPLTSESAWTVVQGLVLAIEARTDEVEKYPIGSSTMAEHLRTISEALFAVTDHICNAHLYGDERTD